MMKRQQKIVAIALIGLFSGMSSLPSYAQASAAIIGSWKRIKDNDQWIMYQYQADGHLLRATDKHPAWQALGGYQIDKDIIHFKNNPDNYTPVRFEIKRGTCHDHTGATLYLYDQKTGDAYGCYFTP